MNIKITYNWLLEYLDTDADPYEIQKYVSLCGPSIERIEKQGDDYVFDIEITSNRVDSASVIGFAQECVAILPQFGKKATLKTNPLIDLSFESLNAKNTESLPLDIEITDDALATRVTGVILANVTIAPSPEFMKNRLEMCDIRSINNVVDISNYLMLTFGQPTHTFDYDKIGQHKLIIRESKKGEKIVTLDELEFELPGGDIVIEDGNGVLTDLAGIMGGFESRITDSTKNVLLFLETYNKNKLRRTSMTTGQRTQAATYFEKGLDEERITPTLVYGVELLQKYASGTLASQPVDLYKTKKQPTTITVDIKKIQNLSGVPFTSDEIVAILGRLGFKTTAISDEITVTVPTYRIDDVQNAEDITEEVTRIYGYHNLPSIVQQTEIIHPLHDMQQLFYVESKIKYFLKHAGFNEVYNYSMISKKMIDDMKLDESAHLHLANTISTEIEYMRTSLVPSLIKNVGDNIGKRDRLHFFEVAKVYKKQDGDLPTENRKIGMILTGDYFELKGVLEGLFAELHIPPGSIHFKKSVNNHLLDQNIQATLYCDNVEIGEIGLVANAYTHIYSIDKPIVVAEVDMSALIKLSRTIAQYKPISPFAVIKLDLTIDNTSARPYGEIESMIKKTSSLITRIELRSTYKNKLTLRMYFTDTARNITEEEAKKELEKIETGLRK